MSKVFQKNHWIEDDDEDGEVEVKDASRTKKELTVDDALRTTVSLEDIIGSTESKIQDICLMQWDSDGEDRDGIVCVDLGSSDDECRVIPRMRRRLNDLFGDDSNLSNDVRMSSPLEVAQSPPVLSSGRSNHHTKDRPPDVLFNDQPAVVSKKRHSSEKKNPKNGSVPDSRAVDPSDRKTNPPAQLKSLGHSSIRKEPICSVGKPIQSAKKNFSEELMSVDTFFHSKERVSSGQIPKPTVNKERRSSGQSSPKNGSSGSSCRTHKKDDRHDLFRKKSTSSNKTKHSEDKRSERVKTSATHFKTDNHKVEKQGVESPNKANCLSKKRPHDPLDKRKNEGAKATSSKSSPRRAEKKIRCQNIDAKSPGKNVESSRKEKALSRKDGSGIRNIEAIQGREWRTPHTPPSSKNHREVTETGSAVHSTKIHHQHKDSSSRVEPKKSVGSSERNHHTKDSNDKAKIGSSASRKRHNSIDGRRTEGDSEKVSVSTPKVTEHHSQQSIKRKVDVSESEKLKENPAEDIPKKRAKTKVVYSVIKSPTIKAEELPFVMPPTPPLCKPDDVPWMARSILAEYPNFKEGSGLSDAADVERVVVPEERRIGKNEEWVTAQKVQAALEVENGSLEDLLVAFELQEMWSQSPAVLENPAPQIIIIGPKRPASPEASAHPEVAMVERGEPRATMVVDDRPNPSTPAEPFNEVSGSVCSVSTEDSLAATQTTTVAETEAAEKTIDTSGATGTSNMTNLNESVNHKEGCSNATEPLTSVPEKSHPLPEVIPDTGSSVAETPEHYDSSEDVIIIGSVRPSQQLNTLPTTPHSLALSSLLRGLEELNNYSCIVDELQKMASDKVSFAQGQFNDAVNRLEEPVLSSLDAFKEYCGSKDVIREIERRSNRLSYVEISHILKLCMYASSKKETKVEKVEVTIPVEGLEARNPPQAEPLPFYPPNKEPPFTQAVIPWPSNMSKKTTSQQMLPQGTSSQMQQQQRTQQQHNLMRPSLGEQTMEQPTAPVQLLMHMMPQIPPTRESQMQHQQQLAPRQTYDNAYHAPNLRALLSADNIQSMGQHHQSVHGQWQQRMPETPSGQQFYPNQSLQGNTNVNAANYHAHQFSDVRGNLAGYNQCLPVSAGNGSSAQEKKKRQPRKTKPKVSSGNGSSEVPAVWSGTHQNSERNAMENRNSCFATPRRPSDDTRHQPVAPTLGGNTPRRLSADANNIVPSSAQTPRRPSASTRQENCDNPFSEYTLTRHHSDAPTLGGNTPRRLSAGANNIVPSSAQTPRHPSALTRQENCDHPFSEYSLTRHHSDAPTLGGNTPRRLSADANNIVPSSAQTPHRPSASTRQENCDNPFSEYTLTRHHSDAPTLGGNTPRRLSAGANNIVPSSAQTPRHPSALTRQGSYGNPSNWGGLLTNTNGTVPFSAQTPRRSSEFEGSLPLAMQGNPSSWGGSSTPSASDHLRDLRDTRLQHHAPALGGGTPHRSSGDANCMVPFIAQTPSRSSEIEGSSALTRQGYSSHNTLNHLGDLRFVPVGQIHGAPMYRNSMVSANTSSNTDTELNLALVPYQPATLTSSSHHGGLTPGRRSGATVGGIQVRNFSNMISGNMPATRFQPHWHHPPCHEESNAQRSQPTQQQENMGTMGLFPQNNSATSICNYRPDTSEFTLPDLT